MKIVSVLACAWMATSALGDVLGEAKYLWDFDCDVSGDGELQLEEVRDARRWGSTNLYGYADAWKPSSIKTNVIDSVGPQWRTGEVVNPTRGITSKGAYLHFKLGTNVVQNANGTCTTNLSGCGIVYDSGAIIGSVSALIRLRADAFDAFFGVRDHVWVIDNGEAWNRGAGSNIGFHSWGENGASHPCIMFGQLMFDMTETVSTNMWYDIGYSLRDTGDGGAEAIFMVRKPDAPNAIDSAAKYKTKGVHFERRTLPAGSGAFTNEAYASKFIRLGGEDIGTKAGVNNNVKKCFAGDIRRIVMWDRALSSNELVEAALETSSLFKIGYDDGKSGEFGLADEIVKPYSVDRAPFREMPQSLTAARPVAELSFTPRSRAAAALGHMLRIKAADGPAGSTRLKATVNGHVADVMALAPGAEKWAYVKPGWLKTGANEIRIERLAQSSTAAAFNFDVVEMSGSWQVSETGNGNIDMSVENSVPTTFYVGDWNFAGMQRGVVIGYSTVRQRFWMPPALAQRHAFVYSGVCTSVEAPTNNYLKLTNSVENGGLGYPYQKWPLTFAVNGQTYLESQCIGKGEGWSFTIPKGALNAGWNEVSATLAVPGVTCWSCFDYFRLSIVPNPSGTLLMLR